ncbi:ATPase domain protein, prokaryote domain protein [Candidatus Magnetomorum sp. HK-1]|nr:ATPase domain protein, prokaryote domain protein [Candidatus Magnetomorum sp. HK-1]
MEIYLKEKIGNPELFTGRYKELKSLLKWTEMSKNQLARSTAMLSRRKTGKSALMHRLYNIVFNNNDGVVPFYYEIREFDQWIFNFSQDYFVNFIWQYIAFKSRNKRYLEPVRANYTTILETVKREKLDYLIEDIEMVKYLVDEKKDYELWNEVRDLPRHIASRQGESIIQMIDEFQYLNYYIYRDEYCTRRFKELAGSYFHTAEYKTAPLLISGSWVGWLMRDLAKMLPGRFRKDYFLGNMPDHEAAETIFKYSDLLDIPISNEIAQLMIDITGGNPCYISALFYSNYPKKDFTHEDGLRETLEFEILNDGGEIKTRWMEYLLYAFHTVNGTDHGLSKKIVLYLCKNKDREVTRDEIKKVFKLEIPDNDLEKKMTALVESDIINRGSSYSEFQGIGDHIFDKVFRGVYQKEIEAFDPKEITNEYKELFKKWKEKFQIICGKYGNLKGRFAEYMISNHLKYRAHEHNDLYCSMMNNLPEDFYFVNYQSVWKYTASPVLKKSFEIDVFARANQADYSLIGEVKNRLSPFSLSEATAFLNKSKELLQQENLEKYVLFVYSIKGFTKEAVQFFLENQIAWCDDEKWLDNYRFGQMESLP